MKRFLLLALLGGLSGWGLRKIQPSSVSRDLRGGKNVSLANPSQPSGKARPHPTLDLLLGGGKQDWVSILQSADQHSEEFAIARAQLLAEDPFQAFRILSRKPIDDFSKDLVDAMMQKDPQQAMKLCNERLSELGDKAGSSAYSELWAPVIKLAPQEAYQRLFSLPGNIMAHDEVFTALFRSWGAADGPAAIQAADALPWNQCRWGAQMMLVRGLAEKDPQAAIQYFINLPDDSRAAIGLIGILGAMKELPPQTALHLLGEQWVNYRHNDPLSNSLKALQTAGTDAQAQSKARGSLYDGLGEFRAKMWQWSAKDPAAAQQWAANFPEPEVRKAVQAAMTLGNMENQPPQQAEQIFTQTDPAYRSGMTKDWAKNLATKGLETAWTYANQLTNPSLSWELQRQLIESTHDSPETKLRLLESVPATAPGRKEMLQQVKEDLQNGD